MIERLLSLELSGFRCFPEKEEISLDADVVLIHGSNGTGKTSLLSALEFALTGRVSELAIFEDDYPRCLRNVDTMRSTYATARFHTPQGEQVTSTHTVNGTVGKGSFPLSADDGRVFRDRCYLSQTSLSRLLENYQACSSEDPEQPLVRFVRELLGLDLLENITSGLYEAALMPRIEKAVPALARVAEEEQTLRQRLNDLQNNQAISSAAWKQGLVALQNLTVEAGDPEPNKGWTPEGVRARLKSYQEGGHERLLSFSLQKLRHAEGQLQRGLGFLGMEESQSNSESLRRRLKAVSTEQRKLEDEILPIISRAERFLAKISPIHSDKETDLALRHETVEAAIKAVATNRDAQGQLIKQSERELAELKSRKAAVEQEITNLTPSASADLTRADSLATALGSILEHLEGDECPVCRRDYSEVHHGHLRAHIKRQIAKLGADAKQLQSIARRREALDAEKNALAVRIAAGVERLKIERDRVSSQEQDASVLQKLSAELRNLLAVRDKWREQLNTVKAIEHELTAVETREKQRKEIAIELEQVFKTIGAPDNLWHQESHALAIALLGFAQKQVGTLERQLAAATQFREALNRASDAGAEWEKVARALSKATQRHQALRKVLSRVKHDVESARQLSKAATSAKTRILQNVFNDTLNQLWRELFQRLVKHEPFQPQLREPKTIRGHIRTSIEAWREGVDPFKQLAAVASSGNLNTAALSLFLSLNLVEQPRHYLLVLDDPIQNMDDLHAVQLANLLREIRQKARRQLILSVHERALFDYLRLELGPTNAQTSLLTVELERSETNGKLEITTTPFQWKPDSVRFGGDVAVTKPTIH